MTSKTARVKPRSRVRVIAITIFALLFAQWNIAAYACPSPTAPGTDAIAPVDCEGLGGHLDEASPNLCAEHCQYGQQSDQLRVPTVPAVSLVGLYVVPLSLKFVDLSQPEIVSSRLLAARPPPHTILHCCFRT